MGLDQYAYFAEKDKTPVEFKYWRKTSHIDGWMRQRFFDKGGKSEDGFNGEPLYLTEQDIQDFISDVKEGKLEWCPGFFFGYEYNAQDCKEDDLAFAYECLKHLNLGRVVYYQNSW